jgi:hypothetical protein
MNDELRSIAKDALGNLIKSISQEERLCKGCIYFKWQGARAGAPENTPSTLCEIFNTGRSCGNYNTVDRLIECYLTDMKELRQ